MVPRTRETEITGSMWHMTKSKRPLGTHVCRGRGARWGLEPSFGSRKERWPK